MKKIVFSVAVMLGLGLTNIQAQGVLGGIKVNANLSNFILSDMDGMKSKLGFGVTAGGYTKIMFGEQFGLQPEILLHFKNSKMEEKAFGEEADFQFFGVEFPVYGVYQMDVKNGKGFIGLGPYLGCGIDARYKGTDSEDDWKLYKEYDGEKSAMQRWDFGAGVMLGYEFSNRLQIQANYKIGFINALNDSNKASMLNQTISVGLGYRFGN